MPTGITPTGTVPTGARVAASNTTTSLLRAFDTNTCLPSGVNFARIGNSPPDLIVATTVSDITSITEIEFAPRFVTQTSRPFGDTSMPSAPAAVGTLRTGPPARGMIVTLPEPMLAT